MIDFRWHTASLVAVFLALGIGVLMGGVAAGGSLGTIQRQALRHVEAEVASLRRDRSELTLERRFTTEALPWIVSGRLAGKCVGIIEVGEPTAEADVVSTLELGGASAFVLDLPADLAPAQAGDPASTDRQATAESLSAALFGQSDLTALESSGVVLVSGRPVPADEAVLLLGPKADPATADLLLQSLTAAAAGRPVVGAVEGGGLYRLFTDRNLSVVDDVQRESGRTALVLALAGASGHFGEQAGASGLIPAWQP